MWIEKAIKARGSLFYLFGDFLDQYGFNEVKVIGRTISNGAPAYHVKANYFVKDLACNFYFNDFSIMQDRMCNESYALKTSDTFDDLHWAVYVAASLQKKDEKEYIKQFKKYQKNKLAEEVRQIDMIV